MSLTEMLDGKTMAMGVLASLTGYIFYGHISLAAKTETIETKQNQVLSEQRDLWNKYNSDLDKKLEFMKEYYLFQLDNEKRWTEYYKEKIKK